MQIYTVYQPVLWAKGYKLGANNLYTIGFVESQVVKQTCMLKKGVTGLIHHACFFGHFKMNKPNSVKFFYLITLVHNTSLYTQRKVPNVNLLLKSV